jgi:hypothetical protein
LSWSNAARSRKNFSGSAALGKRYACDNAGGRRLGRGEWRWGEVSGGQASGATHKDNVPGAPHWIFNEILAAGYKALCERQNSLEVALTDVTCPVLRNR